MVFPDALPEEYIDVAEFWNRPSDAGHHSDSNSNSTHCFSQEQLRHIDLKNAAINRDAAICSDWDIAQQMLFWARITLLVILVMKVM